MAPKSIAAIAQPKFLAASTVFALTLSPVVSSAQNDGAALFVSKACVVCHGDQGRASTNDDIPLIAGQNRNYLVTAITNIRSGARSSGNAVQMKGIAQTLSDQDIELIADYLSSQVITYAN